MNELFHEYLLSTKKLLLAEPANTRVWVSSISTDSFGGVHEILKGWTPGAPGVFTDDLNRARRELASGFELKSSGMAPLAPGTDIFGGLWRLKAFFELTPKADAVPKAIWIFSDMVNETQSFPMPTLVETGPERMLEIAKANGLLVPLDGYKIHIYGVSPSGLRPQAWVTVKKFWTMYFSAAGAELVSYSAECEVQR